MPTPVSSIGRRKLLQRAAGLAAAGMAAPWLAGPARAATALRWSAIAFDPSALALWKQIAARAEGNLPGISVTVEGTSFNDYWTKLQTQLASGGAADLIQMQSLRFPAYAGRNVLRPLNDFIKADPAFDVADFYPGIRQAFEHDGQLQILPFDLGAFVTYINKDLFRAAGVPLPDAETPMSWAKLLEISKALTNPKTSTYGMVLAPNLESSIPWIWSNGGEIFSADLKQARIADARSKEALGYLFDLLFTHKVAAPVTSLSNANFATEAFVGGKVAMYFDGPWRFVSVRQNAKFDWDVAPFPAGAAGSVPWVAGSGWGISTRSANPAAAWSLLKELTSTNSLKILDDAGRVFPARQSTFALRQPTDAAPKNVGVVDKVLHGTIGKARPLLPPASWAEINQRALQILSPLFLERGDVNTEMATLQDEMQTLLSR